ncbi:type VI secretion system contractile sheath large subunit [Paraburkholderia sp. BL10I2N1]|uniref:type VI secretion system contractile sheath large subunit n=1 Tax=Paraburkholderia sp. BL10I2N1 TaxID=1938796 RepID=UPI001FB67509|nr:type VI secretion system contractile sheath large subunit [Paraburkholderia sp. BL10I2N1]
MPEGDDLAALLEKEFRSKTEGTKKALRSEVRTLAQQVLLQDQVVPDDVVRTIQTLVAGIDGKLAGQLNLILHHPEFQQLEGSWRGLHYLVNNTDTSEMLKIRTLNIAKSELGETLERFRDDAWEQSPLFRTVCQEPFAHVGGEPFGALIGDFYFDHGPPDLELLGGMASLAAAAQAPFIAGASPKLMQMDSWQELARRRDLTGIFNAPEYAGWRSLRESAAACYVGLAMPRFLARMPYGARTAPVDQFEFEEDTGSAEHGKYVWANAAYAMAVNINRSFNLYGWCARIRGVESGGALEGLPAHSFPGDDGSVETQCPTEIAISDRCEAELAKNGFMPLIHRKHADFAAFIGAQSLQKPAEYDDSNATANAALAARLPYCFACSRFAHYLRCIARDRLGTFKGHADMERWLNNWIMNYVDGDPLHSSEFTRAQKPLAAARVRIEPVEGSPGYYTSQFFLRPYYQLDGLTVSLCIVSTLPSGKFAA